MKHILFLILISQLGVLIGQDKKNISLLETDNTWRKETLSFPFPFARDIKLEGDIDVRFSKGWSKIESPYFWSYAFVWDVSRSVKFTEKEIEEYMQLYLGGLMKAVNSDKNFVVPETITLFSEVSAAENQSSYKGKIRMHDSFFSKKIVTLNVVGEIHYCNKEQRALLFFKLSPKDLDNKEVWNYLNQAKPILKSCTP